jgi:uncharacterized protein YecT (DUF1311 family)
MQLSGRFRILSVLLFSAALVITGGLLRSSATANEQANPQESAPSTAPPAQSSAPQYDKAIFQKPVPPDQLAFLNNFAGSTSNDVIRDKQYRKLLKTVVPDCTFHYGTDMSLFDALDTVIKDSRSPVQIRDGRYMMISGRSGPYLLGRGFMWFDMQDGIALGGFYFHPTNGEPTPTVAIFSRQVKEKEIEMSQLPEAFAEDLGKWARSSNVPPVTTRYFITGSNQRIVLEHDEDYCDPAKDGKGVPNEDCEQMNADAGDIDMNAVTYVNQTNHATNATEWMITGDDQIAWIQVRDNTCRVGPDPLGCHIRMTRERTHVLMGHPGPSPAPHGHR